MIEEMRSSRSRWTVLANTRVVTMVEPFTSKGSIHGNLPKRYSIDWFGRVEYLKVLVLWSFFERYIASILESNEAFSCRQTETLQTCTKDYPPHPLDLRTLSNFSRHLYIVNVPSALYLLECDLSTDHQTYMTKDPWIQPSGQSIQQTQISQFSQMQFVCHRHSDFFFHRCSHIDILKPFWKRSLQHRSSRKCTHSPGPSCAGQKIELCN